MNPLRPQSRVWSHRLLVQARRSRLVAYTTLQLLALAVWPGSYRGATKRELERQIWRSSWPQLPGFVLLGGLLGLVLIQIVWTTAQSYGLSHVALEVMVRVLALELLPLLASLFVALRCSLPMLSELQSGPAPGQPPLEWLGAAVFTRALAVVFTVWLLVAASGLLVLVLSYLVVHGWSPWGLGPFGHTVGRVFSPWVTVVFLLKTLGFSLAVGVVPLAHAAALVLNRTEPLGAGHDPRERPAAGMAGLARLTGGLLVFEVMALLAYI